MTSDGELIRQAVVADTWVDELRTLRRMIEQSPAWVWEEPQVRRWSAEVARILAIYANLDVFTLQYDPEQAERLW